MSHLCNIQCSSVEHTISRQVGPRSPLFCQSCVAPSRDTNVNTCSSVEHAISRQVGVRSPLYCRSCEVVLTPTSHESVNETICRIAGPRSSLCRR